jgi:hypothetical protein
VERVQAVQQLFQQLCSICYELSTIICRHAFLLVMMAQMVLPLDGGICLLAPGWLVAKAEGS